MEKYCVDLEIAKELKENGYPQKGNLAFFDLGFKDPILNFTGSDSFVLAYAPCSDELLEELPVSITHTDGVKYDLKILSLKNGFEVEYRNEQYECSLHFIECDKLANGLGQLWLKVYDLSGEN